MYVCIYIYVWQSDNHRGRKKRISPEISQIIWAKSLTVLIEKSRSREKWLVHTANWWKEAELKLQTTHSVIHWPLISVLDKHLVIRASKHSIPNLKEVLISWGKQNKNYSAACQVSSLRSAEGWEAYRRSTADLEGFPLEARNNWKS